MALADPTRRRIIDALHLNGPQSIKQLQQGSGITRQALTKHLDRLIKAKVVSAEFVGKCRIHTLHPKSLAQLARWMQPFVQQWDERLQALQEHLEDRDD